MKITFPEQLSQKLQARQSADALRILPAQNNLIDFSSNDYLGFARNISIFNAAHDLLSREGLLQNGATGSRLISGNYPLCERAEFEIAAFHNSPSALLFNSGYDANLGFFSSVPQRGDIILYDALCHASIRDGIRLSPAKAYKFAHNDIESVENLLESHRERTVYVATESVFSMDGDTPNLEEMVSICERHGAYLVVDEAHALGVFGEKGEGAVQMYGIEDRVFARIVTFGKALGCHGAAVLGSNALKNYLVNFARSFIYTTGLPPHSVATIMAAYGQLASDGKALAALRGNINFFNAEKVRTGLKPLFVRSKSAIQSAIVPGNENVKRTASALAEKGFDVKAILSPTVPSGQERLRICLHTYNSETEIASLLRALAAAI
jgi:8-amino-7-oxononanoate synthase